MKSELLKKLKEPFNFSYTVPYLDWYKTINVTIDYNEYLYFELNIRFGPSYYLIGYKKDIKGNTISVDLGELGFENALGDVVRFIRWCRTDFGSKILRINVISSSFNIFKYVKKLGDLANEI